MRSRPGWRGLPPHLSPNLVFAHAPERRVEVGGRARLNEVRVRRPKKSRILGPSPDPTLPTPPEGSLYSATAADFQASDAVVYRSLGPQPPLRSAKYDSKWLRGQGGPGGGRLLLGRRCRGRTVAGSRQMAVVLCRYAKAGGCVGPGLSKHTISCLSPFRATLCPCLGAWRPCLLLFPRGLCGGCPAGKGKEVGTRGG